MFISAGTIAVYVADKERAKKFYTDILGFEVAADLGPDLCFLVSKNGRISIYLEGGKEPSSCSVESSRLGFYLQAEKPAREVFETLKRAGVRLLEDEPHAVSDDTACFRIEDPDGNIIDISGDR